MIFIFIHFLKVGPIVNVKFLMRVFHEVCVSLCVYLCASICTSFAAGSSSQDSPRLRIKRMLARDSSPDTFLCDTPGDESVYVDKIHR